MHVGGLRPIAVRNTFRRLSANVPDFESFQVRYASRQVGVTPKNAELAEHVFHCLIEVPQPKETEFLKIDFQNTFNLINRQFMLENTFEYTLNFLSTHTGRTIN